MEETKELTNLPSAKYCYLPKQESIRRNWVVFGIHQQKLWPKKGGSGGMPYFPFPAAEWHTVVSRGIFR